MNQVFKLLRLLAATAVHTAYLAVKVRRLPPEDRDRYRAHRQTVGCRALCRIIGVEVVCPPLPDADEPTLIVCNHRGVLDPLVLAACRPMSFAAKADIRSWPFVGWVTREMGVIFVERERSSRAGAFVAEVQSKMDAGVPVTVFPEGTTSATESVKPFKTGAFEAVAGTEGGRVQPLYLRVAEVNGVKADASARGLVTWADSDLSFYEHFFQLLNLKSVRFEVTAGAPADTTGKNRKQLAAETHAMVSALQAAA